MRLIIRLTKSWAIKLLPLALLALALALCTMSEAHSSNTGIISTSATILAAPIKPNAWGKLMDCNMLETEDCTKYEWIVAQCLREDTLPEDCLVYD